MIHFISGTPHKNLMNLTCHHPILHVRKVRLGEVSHLPKVALLVEFEYRLV